MKGSTEIGTRRSGEISRDTTLCISLAGRPTNIGTRFHNYLYRELGIDFVYKAFTTTDIVGAISGVRALGIRGCSVSMPFKQDVIGLVDELEPSAASIGAVNTIVNTAGRLVGSNTDQIAVAALLNEHRIPPTSTVAIAGSGGMAAAVASALVEHGVNDALVVARNERTGRDLAARFGFEWAPELTGAGADVLVNATPIGMAGDSPGIADRAGPGDAASTAFPFPVDAIDGAATVFDVVAFPSDTPMIRRASARSIPVITGAEVIARQAAEQFERYTGVRPGPDLVARASEWSRS